MAVKWLPQPIRLVASESAICLFRTHPLSDNNDYRAKNKSTSVRPVLIMGLTYMLFRKLKMKW